MSTVFPGPAYRRAELALDDAIAQLRKAGYPRARRIGPLEASVRSASGERRLTLRMRKEGRVFGGTYALEVSTGTPVLPATRGLAVRARGVVGMKGVSFRARRGDEEGRRLAERLGQEERLGKLLAAVHFERVRIEPDGRVTIRHMGGSVVWVLFPPIVRTIPFVPEQAQATVQALAAFQSLGD